MDIFSKLYSSGEEKKNNSIMADLSNPIFLKSGFVISHSLVILLLFQFYGITHNYSYKVNPVLLVSCYRNR